VTCTDRSCVPSIPVVSRAPDTGQGISAIW